MRYATPVSLLDHEIEAEDSDKLSRRAIFSAAPIISALSTSFTTVAGPTEVSRDSTRSQPTPARTFPFQQTTAQLAGVPRTNDWPTTAGCTPSHHCLAKNDCRSTTSRLINRMSPSTGGDQRNDLAPPPTYGAIPHALATGCSVGLQYPGKRLSCVPLAKVTQILYDVVSGVRIPSSRAILSNK